MAFPTQADVDQLKRQWTDRFITVKPDARPELKRFEGKVGRVVTVSYSGRAVVDFADGAWYDVPQFENVFIEVTEDAEKKKYDTTANSAQPKPGRQG
jgi:hypothetical protein